MGARKKSYQRREDEIEEDEGHERDEDEEEEDEEEVEVPSLLDEPLKDPVDRQTYLNCFGALLTAAKLKGGKIDCEKIADEAEDAFYACVARFGGRR